MADNKGDASELAEEWRKLEEERRMLEEEKIEFDNERTSLGLEPRLFVGNVDPSTTDEEFLSYFRPYGHIKSATILRDRDGNSKRSGFVHFFYTRSARLAIETLDQRVADKNQSVPLAVRIANRRPPQGPNMPYGGFPQQGMFPPAGPGYRGFNGNAPFPGGFPQPPAQPGQARPIRPNVTPGANLYVNNLDPNLTEDQVRQIFSAYGEVTSVKLYPQNCYGFVSYEDPAQAQSAITYLHGSSDNSNGNGPLEVSLKKDKPFFPPGVRPNGGRYQQQQQPQQY